MNNSFTISADPPLGPLYFYKKDSDLFLKGKKCQKCKGKITLRDGVHEYRRRGPDKKLTKWRLVCGPCYKKEDLELNVSCFRVLTRKGILKKNPLFLKEFRKEYKRLELKLFND